MQDALQGVTILEVGVMTPGKYCGFLMTGWGARSIRVERPGGAGEITTEDLQLNRGKRSITLNLRDPRGRDALLRLCVRADVLIEGYRPGVTGRLGIDYDAVRAVNESIVYCSLSGFGQDGPDRQRPAFDLIFQARSGFSSLLGDGPPHPPRTWLADSVSGLMAACTISAALRKREATGTGIHIDLAMLDSVFSLLSVSHGTVGADGRSAGDEAERRSHRPAYDIYEAGDGRFVALGAARPASCRALFEHLGRPDLADRGLETGPAGAEAAGFLHAALKAKPAQGWVDELSALDIEAAVVATPREAFDDPQLKARNMVAEMAHPQAGALRQIGVPAAGAIDPGPAPAIGADTDAVLRELGYDAAAVSELRADGVV